MNEYRVEIRHWLTHKADIVNIFGTDEEDVKDTVLRMFGSNWEVISMELVTYD